MKTFSVKINVSTGSDKEIAGLLKKKLGMSEFSHGELRVHMSPFGICTAQYGL